MIKKYTVLINKDDQSDWGVSFVDLPIHIVNSNLEDALAQCQEAFEEFMEDESELPKPTPLEKVVASKEGREATALNLVDIDISFFNDPTTRINVSAKKSQLDKIDKAAKKEGKTRSAFMIAASVAVAAIGLAALAALGKNKS